MVANPHRRAALADAALEVLGAQGARALTHRAVDAKAGVPVGTCANYFGTRADLMVGMAQRVFESLTPDQVRLAALSQVAQSEAAPSYVAYVVERLLAQPHLAIALLELRLEASRSPEVAEVLAPFLRAGLDEDITFHTSRGLPGGAQSVLLLHHVVNGIVLDTVTTTLDPDADPQHLAREATRRLLEGVSRHTQPDD